MNTLLRYLSLKLSKPELDYFSTIFGLTATIFTILVTNEVIDKKLGTTVAGISAAIVSILINNPASIHPNTNETEEQITDEDKPKYTNF